MLAWCPCTTKQLTCSRPARLCCPHRQRREVFAHLRSPWSDLPYRVGDAVNLIAQLDLYDGQLHCLLEGDSGLLVLHPDVLLSGGAGLGGRRTMYV